MPHNPPPNYLDLWYLKSIGFLDWCQTGFQPFYQAENRVEIIQFMEAYSFEPNLLQVQLKYQQCCLDQTGEKDAFENTP